MKKQQPTTAATQQKHTHLSSSMMSYSYSLHLHMIVMLVQSLNTFSNTIANNFRFFFTFPSSVLTSGDIAPTLAFLRLLHELFILSFVLLLSHKQCVLTYKTDVTIKELARGKHNSHWTMHLKFISRYTHTK